jgi:cytochrome c5
MGVGKVLLFILTLVATSCSLETHRDYRSNIAAVKPPKKHKDLPADASLDGAKLYENHCASCHGQLAISSKTGRSADDIKRAIAEIPSMNALATLTMDELKAIADALDSSKTIGLVSAPMGTRTYLSSAYQAIFVNSTNATAAENQAILKLIDSYILNQPESHGGPCTRYDNDRDGKILGCAKVDRLNDLVLASSDISPQPTITRFGYRVKACETILSLPKASSNALVNAGIAGAKVDGESLGKLAELFYPGRPLPPFATSELFALAKAASAEGLEPNDQWKFVMLPMCMSFLMDVL